MKLKQAAPDAVKTGNTVLYGVHRLDNLSLSSRTVGQVKQQLATVLNLAKDVMCVVNGEPAGDDRQLSECDTVEFVKDAGQKG